MNSAFRSVPDAQSSDRDAAALMAEIQDDLNALALKLAREAVWREDDERFCCVCHAECLPSQTLTHETACVVGNIIKLTARLGELRDQAARERDFAALPPERHIEYSPIAGRGVAALLDPDAAAVVERVSYEEAAERNRAGLAVRA